MENSILTWDSLRHLRKLRKYLIPLDAVESNSKLLVFGNGPSLAQQLREHTSYFQKYDAICLNKFALSEYFQVIRPRYYLFVDPVWFEPEDELDKFTQREMNETLHRLENDVTWDMDLILAAREIKNKNLMRVIQSNKKIKVRTLCTLEFHGFHWLGLYLRKKGLNAFPPHTSPVASLYAGFLMGYREIQIFGIDSNWVKDLVVTEQNHVAVKKYDHFYGGKPMVLESPDGAGSDKHMADVMKENFIIFQVYMDIAEYAREIGVKIINMTPGSFVDAFERGALE